MAAGINPLTGKPYGPGEGPPEIGGGYPGNATPPQTPGPASPPTGGGTPGMATTSFNPTANLVGSQFTPTPSTRGSAAGAAADSAAGAVGSWQAQPFQGVNPVNQQPTLDLYSKAKSQTQGAQTPGYEGVAAFDPTRSNAALDKASATADSLKTGN